MPNSNLNPQGAYEVLVDSVYAPTFFAKVARDYGWQPTNREEAAKAIKVASKLRNAYELEQVKEAKAKGNILDAADNTLDQLLNAYGYPTSNEPDTTYKEAAADAVKLPNVREAAVV